MAFIYIFFSKIYNSNAESSYLDKVFTHRDHINVHSSINATSENIFQSFPKSFQEYIVEKWNQRSLSKLYSFLDYTIP